ncbi:MAG: hypothetical protein CBC47_05395 [Alphaproteobacteria bacterium TMED87]|nr:hypothetical protein [Rhodospirillaceae bacterium]OUV09338.1 MAG: hypothetical protein CBC47_05395 [Alphaproteobacteria bacterium TMED87]|tara:strand:- start:86 stop:445 length:360 start_codon:yes stop_codon:yes gene_type:complete
MEESEIIKLANSKAKGKRPFFYKDTAVERVLSVTMAIATELAVTRDRLDTVERLLENEVPVTKKSIDSYAPDDEILKERQQWQANYISRILRIFQQENEGVEDISEKSSEELADFNLDQ